MIESWPDRLPESAGFERFRSAIQPHCSDVRFARIGSNLLVVGTVRSFALKSLIDSEAESQGLAIQNWVRVVPGEEARLPDDLSLAG